MKITKEHVGKKVFQSNWFNDDWIIVTAVGEKYFLGKSKNIDEFPYKNAEDWQLYHAPFMIDCKEVKVGDLLVHPDRHSGSVMVKRIDLEKRIFWTMNNQAENFNSSWQFYQEPKPKKLVALALVKDTAGWFIPDKLYSSLEMIQSDFTLSDKIVWPAVPNAQGFYEVEE